MDKMTEYRELYEIIKRNFDENYKTEICGLAAFTICCKYKIYDENEKTKIMNQAKIYFNEIKNDLSNLFYSFINSNNNHN